MRIERRRGGREGEVIRGTGLVDGIAGSRI
jgi:hypothetical protein